MSEEQTNLLLGDSDPGAACSAPAFVRGTVARVTFRNEVSGFSVLKVEPEGEIEVTTVVGIFPSELRPGSTVIARGDWQTHPRFGRQFRAQSITETKPTTKKAITNYLSSGAVKGFGPVLAKRVVAAFGEDTLKVIDEAPHRLLDVQGIGKKKLQEIREAWVEKENLREVILFFETYDVPLSLVQRMYRAYGERAIETVSANPYILASEVWGIGFLTADRIARALGIDERAKDRISAGMSFTLRSATEDGHCFLPTQELITRASSLLALDDFELLESGLEDALLKGDVIKDGDNVYSPALFRAETQLTKNLAERIYGLGKISRPIPRSALERIASKPIVTSDGAPSDGKPKIIHLSSQQKHALQIACDSSLLVITGGPGCGKTTLVKSVSRLFRMSGLNVKLAAPTGRAAQRLAEVCEMSASTIHRLLKYDPMTHDFAHDAHNPLELDALILDESSMIDIPLAASLFNAIPPHARIVVVGDADQLPSVGPGLFLRDLLAVEGVPSIRLTTLFRRASESAITQVAHQINAGAIPDIPKPDGNTKSEAYFLSVSDREQAAKLVERLVTEQIPKKFGLRGTDITVLTPMNKGELGVKALNKRLQQLIVPATSSLAHVTLGEIDFRLGDRVCQRVNNYNITPNGVFNGDRGVIIGIDREAKAVYVKLWDGREVQYTGEALQELDLAYALTIHRSQGSEVPAVVLVLHDSHNILLERQLIYTAVTRAKRLLVVVGTRKALIISSKRTRSRRRYTALKQKTEELVSKAR